jgi:putative transposase
MPRISRGIAGGYIYHVLNRGNGGQRVFHKNDDYRSFVSLISEATSNIPIKIFGYCIMPNHFHFVLMPINSEDLSHWMQWLMTSHVRRYHCHYGTSGHVWQGRFKSFLVQEDNHLLTVLRYVEGNPVRSNIVSSAMDWPWSSFRKRLQNVKDSLLSDPPLVLPPDWQNFVDEPLTPMEIEKFAVSLRRQRPFGLPEWQTRICKEMDLGSTLTPRGRPRTKKSSLSPF